MERRISRRRFLKEASLTVAGAAILPQAFGGKETAFSKESKIPLSFYFPETGHHAEGEFLDFWRRRGGKLIFGWPITEVMVESGLPVQYFQKARFELHPDGEVKLGLLGSELFEENGFSPSEELPLPAKFSLFYQKRGGLEIFGYPISPSFEEEERVVQYFQRAKFEYHPQTVDSFYRQKEKLYGLTLLSLTEVQLANLGEMAAAKKGLPTSPVPQKEGTLDYSSFSPVKKIIVDLSNQELTAFEDETPISKAAVSTGLVVPGILSGTPPGNFQVLGKYQELTYKGWNPLLGIRYEYPRVPFNLHFWPPWARLYFIHGTYWHNNFGRPQSQGCVNLDLDLAQELFEWAEIGTKIEIY